MLSFADRARLCELDVKRSTTKLNREECAFIKNLADTYLTDDNSKSEVLKLLSNTGEESFFTYFEPEIPDSDLTIIENKIENKIESLKPQTNQIFDSLTKSEDRSNSDSDIINLNCSLNMSSEVLMNSDDFNTLKSRLDKIKVHSLSLPQLKSEEFNDWNIVCESKLTLFCLSDFILKKPESSLSSDIDYKFYDNFVKANLIISVTESLRKDISSLSSSYKCWSFLCSRFEGNDHIKCIRLFKKLINTLSSKNSHLEHIVSEFKDFGLNIKKLFPDLDTKPFIGLLFAVINLII